MPFSLLQLAISSRGKLPQFCFFLVAFESDIGK